MHSANKLHIPILLEEILEFCQQGAEPKTILDATFGRGGHSRAFLEHFPQAKLVCVDRDEEAIRFGESTLAEEVRSRRVTFIHQCFSEFMKATTQKFDFILIDLGVSSPQLDQPGRGFSFYHNGPLDMRMDTRQSETAADLINTCSEAELIEIFQRYGELRRPHRVVRAIVEDRKQRPYRETRELASLIERVDGWRKKGSHPATKYFLALRLVVNRELEIIDQVLEDLVRCIEPDGRLAILTFHSLEDRIVKHGMRQLKSLARAINKKVIVAGREEQKVNVRSRSAKLRVYQKCGEEAVAKRSNDEPAQNKE